MSPRLASAPLALAALLAPRLAAAQPAPPPPPDPRLGLFGGFGLHAGNLSCEGTSCPDFREAGGISGHLGYAFSDRLGVVLDVWTMGSTENRLTIVHTISTLGVRYWVAPVIWLQGGLGHANARFRYDASVVQLQHRTEDVPALMLGGGIELVRGKRFALDLQLRVGFGFYGEDDDGDGRADTTGRSASLAAGLTWF